jgi:hypothetical protein
MSQHDRKARIMAGVRKGDKPACESEHFYTCAECGQAVDCRDLSAVLTHEIPGHRPMPTH